MWKEKSVPSAITTKAAPVLIQGLVTRVTAVGVLMLATCRHHCCHMTVLFWLVGQGHPSEKYEFVNWDDDISNISGKIKLMATKPPTSIGSKNDMIIETDWVLENQYLTQSLIEIMGKEWHDDDDDDGDDGDDDDDDDDDMYWIVLICVDMCYILEAS